MKYLFALVFAALFSFTIFDEEKLAGGRVMAADLDNTGNAYFVDSAYRIQKRMPGKKNAMFSLTNYGENIIIDASNPVEIFAFYANSGFVLVFDNNLNPSREINLFNQNTLAPSAFGRANDGNIWVFDNRSGTLKKFDLKANLLQESVVLVNGIKPTATVNRIIDNGETVAFLAPDSSIQLLNPNLFIGNTIKGPFRKLLAVNGNSVLADNGKAVLRISFGSKLTRTDTVHRYEPNEEVMAMQNGKMLIRTAQGLFLRP